MLLFPCFFLWEKRNITTRNGIIVSSLLKLLMKVFEKNYIFYNETHLAVISINLNLFSLLRKRTGKHHKTADEQWGAEVSITHKIVSIQTVVTRIISLNSRE